MTLGALFQDRDLSVVIWNLPVLALQLACLRLPDLLSLTSSASGLWRSSAGSGAAAAGTAKGGSHNTRLCYHARAALRPRWRVSDPTERAATVVPILSIRPGRAPLQALIPYMLREIPRALS